MNFRSYIAAVTGLAVIALAVSVLNGGVAHAFQVIPGHPAATIGSAAITLPYDAAAMQPTVLTVFVPTGSASDKCLLTLGDSNAAIAGQSVHCMHRVVNGVDGVFIAIFALEAFQPDAFVNVTVYQERAQFYGAPVVYTGP